MKRYLDNRLKITNEFMTKYKPNVIWFDGGATDSPLEILSSFYNTGEKGNKEVEVHNKDKQFGDALYVYSYERGYLRPTALLNHPWEDDETSSVSGSWSCWYGKRKRCQYIKCIVLYKFNPKSLTLK